MAPERRMGLMKRRAASAAGVIAALAIAVTVAAPVSEASAATPTAARLPALPALPALGAGLPALGAGLPAFGALPAFDVPALGFVGPQVAIGPTVIGSVFNGGTSVVVSNDPPVNSGNVIASP
jgi:hypothetical protein